MTTYKVWLHEIKANGPNDRDLPGAFYGRVPGVGMNFPIYCRTDEDDAYEFDKNNAIEVIRDFRRSGYPCHAIPPITVTY